MAQQQAASTVAPAPLPAQNIGSTAGQSVGTAQEATTTAATVRTIRVQLEVPITTVWAVTMAALFPLVL